MDQAVDYVHRKVLNKPKEYYTLDKLRKAASVDRRITLRELLEEEFDKFVVVYKPQQATSILAIKTYFKVYITGDLIRHVIDSRKFADLATTAVFSLADYRAVPEKYRALVPEYVKDYVSLSQFILPETHARH